MEGLAMTMKPTQGLWANKKIVVTGHTGFKGSWLTLWLNSLGANVVGISLEPKTSPNLYTLSNVADCCESYFCNINDAVYLAEIIQNADPDFVFHLAAQPLVRESYVDPVETFTTNILGTVNLLEAIKTKVGIIGALVITTDKVYKNNEWCWPYREVDVLGGRDPYSASKAAAEIVVDSYRSSFFEKSGTKIVTARAGNVIGGGDWAPDRLIPDAIRAWGAQKTLNIRCPTATRPWQHVLEALWGYILIAEKIILKHNVSKSFNIGPDYSSTASVKKVIDESKKYYPNSFVNYGHEENMPHESGNLSLDNSLAKTTIGYEPRWNLEDSIRRTLEWYRQLNNGKSAYDLCMADIKDFEDNFGY